MKKVAKTCSLHFFLFLVFLSFFFSFFDSLLLLFCLFKKPRSKLTMKTTHLQNYILKKKPNVYM